VYALLVVVALLTVTLLTVTHLFVSDKALSLQLCSLLIAHNASIEARDSSGICKALI
jgi:hypothetical protein